MKSSVFEKTYKEYLGQIADLDLIKIKDKLDVRVDDKNIIIPVFDKVFQVSNDGMYNSEGKRPSFDVCIIISKYLLLCPEQEPQDKEWVSFKDLKDSGPLTKYFTTEIDDVIIKNFAGKIDLLKYACKKFGGYPPNTSFSQDIAMQFTALPKIPILLLFNDRDEEFPASCTILFEWCVEQYLDPECIAMLGNYLSSSLKEMLKSYNGEI